MADAGDALLLQRGGGREQRAGGSEEHAVPPALLQHGNDVAAEHGGAAAGAGTAAVHILALQIVEQQAAVAVAAGEVQPLPPGQLQQDPAAELSQVAGDDAVEIGGRIGGVAEEGAQGVQRRGRHGGAHVVGVGDALVHDAPPGDMGDAGPRSLPGQQRASGGSGGPLGGGVALAAVGQRHAVLPLGAAEVGGGEGGGPVQKPGGYHQRRQGKSFAHGGTGAVQAVQGDGHVPQGKGGADALVQQVPAEDAVQVLRPEGGLFQCCGQHGGLHGGFGLLVGLFAEIGVGLQPVEKSVQRAAGFVLSAEIGAGRHNGGGREADGLRFGHEQDLRRRNGYAQYAPDRRKYPPNQIFYTCRRPKWADMPGFVTNFTKLMKFI